VPFPLLTLLAVLGAAGVGEGRGAAVVSGPVSSFGAATDSAGTVWVAVAWPDARLQVLRSDDRGGSWSSLAWVPLDSVARQVEVVVGRGDSGRVFVFYLSAANEGDLWAVALDPENGEWRRSTVSVGPDTIDDFAVAVDWDTNYYLYCLFANEQRTGLTGHFTRSRDFGRSWEATQDWWNCWDPCLAHTAGSTVHAVWRDAESGRRIYYTSNRHYGAAANWGQLHSVGTGTGRSFGPVVVQSDTLPEWFSTVWVFYAVGRRDSSMTDIEFAFSTDGGWSWQTGLTLDSSFGDEWLVDAQVSRGGSAVDICYYYGGKGPNEPTAVLWRCGSSLDPGFFSAAVKVSDVRCEPRADGCRPRVVQLPGAVPHGPGFLFSRFGPEGVWFSSPFGGKPDTASRPAIAGRPNPFRAGTCVRLAVADDPCGHVAVFDALGRPVRVVRDGRWDGRDERGRRVPAGAYLLRCGRAQGRVVVSE